MADDPRRPLVPARTDAAAFVALGIALAMAIVIAAIRG